MRWIIFFIGWGIPIFSARAQLAMISYHNDDARTGLNPNETILNPDNVNANSFGKLFSHALDGQVFAQPLVVPNLSINGANHNVVFICTGHDSVYAFDADDAAGADAKPLWQTSFLNSGNGVTVSPVPYLEIASCQDMIESGIADTPAIDLSTNTLYVVAETKEVSSGSSSASTFRVHCGGSQYVDSLGQTWSADTGFNGGFTDQTANKISGTSDPTLYDDERAGNPFTYSFAVPPGSYQVTLKFAEVFWNSPGQRVFNVSINGAQVLTNFDIVADAGGANQADDKQFNNIKPDSNGQITVQLGPASVDNAKVSAIQIIPQPSSTSALRVHCGGSQYVDSLGQTWSADTGFNGGFTYQTANAISGTSDPTLYDDERAGNPYTYSFAVPPGSYQVTLKFAEVFWNSPGQRVFNVSINGAQVLTNFDIVADAGGANQADDKVFSGITPDSNGQITVQLGPASVDNAKLSAIQIISQSTGTTVSTLKPRPTGAPSDPVTTYVHRLHALDLLTGAEKFGGPVTVAAVWNGIGGPITFNSQWQINRPGLVLSGGLLYTFWASHCDDGQYYGWVLAYSPSDLSLQSVFNTAPVTQRGGIWQAGAPPAIDTDGTFFMNTATGVFDAAFGGVDYGESVIHFQPGLNPAIIDYFSPFNEAQLDATDNEMGSAGEMILPDAVGSPNHPHLVTGGDKAGDVFLMDRQNLGGFQQGPNGSDAVVQEFHEALTNNFAIFGTPCYYNGMVYWNCVGGPIQNYSISNAQYNTTPLSSTPEVYNYPGCVSSISSNGPSNSGILWAIQPGNPAVLRAYGANNLSIELYDSDFNASRDGLGTPNTKFTPPTIINGKVYVATTGSLAVFGLLGPSALARKASAQAVKGTPTATPTSTPTATPTSSPTPYIGEGPVVAAPNVVRASGTVTFQVPEGGASLEVSIYDLAGEKVAELEGAPGLSRLTWDPQGAASGLYLARVKVTDADGNSRQQMLKVAVIH